jgi:hypothetical protein
MSDTTYGWDKVATIFRWGFDGIFGPAADRIAYWRIWLLDYPDHPANLLPDLSKAIPLLLHGDEGRALNQKKMILSIMPAT